MFPNIECYLKFKQFWNHCQKWLPNSQNKELYASWQLYHNGHINGSQLAKMKKSIPDMFLP